MSTMEYEDYVREQQQQVIVTEQQIKEQKQVELRQIVYDELLKKYQILQNEKKEDEDKIKTLESIVMDYMEREQEYNVDRIVELPYGKMHLMFMLEQTPTSIFVCFNKEDKLKWVKAPHEMIDKGIPK